MASAYLLQALHYYSHNMSQNMEITLIGEEEDCCYNRVLLSSVLAGEKHVEDLSMLSNKELDHVHLISGVRIERIDTSNRVAYTHLGTQYAYDKLVIATGSQVSLPQIANLHIDGIEVFRSLEDTQHLQKLPSKHRSAIVVGGGLLGLEAAHGLNAQGFSTTVVHRNQCLMNRQLDVSGANFLQAALAGKGIGFQMGTQVAELHHENRKLQAVSLANGDYLACDLLLFATGITPNTALAQASGIHTEHGIMVNTSLESSDPGVYALGECSQIGQECFGLVAPIRAQAIVLAKKLAGLENAEYALEDWPTTLKISGIEIFRAGVLDDAAENIVLNAPSTGTYRRLIIRSNRLVGAVLVGDKRHGAWYSELIKEQTDISDIRSSFMFGPKQSQPQSLHDLAA